MCNRTSLLVLLKHVPLSKEEREHVYFVQRMSLLNLNVLTAQWLAIMAIIIGIAVTVLAVVGVVGWKKGLIVLGVASMCLVTFREIARTIIGRRFESRCEALRILSDQEELHLADVLSRHSELQDVLDQWAVDSDQLTVSELKLIETYILNQ